MLTIHGLVLPISALNVTETHTHENGVGIQNIEPRASLCSTCGNGTLYSSVSYGNWIAQGQTTSCRHGKLYGTDKIFRRVKVTTLKCSNCGILGTEDTYEYKYECHGYN